MAYLDFDRLLEPYRNDNLIGENDRVVGFDQGGLNTVLFIGTHSTQRRFVLRVPLEGVLRESTENHIIREYAALGVDNPYDMRSIARQVNDTISYYKKGIPILQPVGYTENSILYPFVPYPTYREINTNSVFDDQLVLDVYQENLEYLLDAHKKQVVIGDRWGPNDFILISGSVRNKTGLMVLDKDSVNFVEPLSHIQPSYTGKKIEIIGFDLDVRVLNREKELEIAQAVYYTLRYTRDREADFPEKMARLLKQTLPNNYDLWKIDDIVGRHDKFFNREKHEDGGAVNRVMDFLEALHS